MKQKGPVFGGKWFVSHISCPPGDKKYTNFDDVRKDRSFRTYVKASGRPKPSMLHGESAGWIFLTQGFATQTIQRAELP